MIEPFNTSMLTSILPEIALLVLVMIVMLIDLIRHSRSVRLGGVTAAGLLGIVALMLLFAHPGDKDSLVLGGMLHFDRIGFTFKVMIYMAAAITCLLTSANEELDTSGEFYILLLVSVLGMGLMVMSADLIMLYLSIETTSIPLYVLAGFARREQRSTEAGVKYMLFGAISSAVMLYGFSLLFGISGETNLYALTTALMGSSASLGTILGAAVLVLIGLAFKISAVPFHFWAPDVYEGAPTAVTAFISTASKAAGFMVLVRISQVVFPGISETWTLILAIIATVTMTTGNLLALAQDNIKRMLAYSSIAHAGYVLIGLVTYTTFGVASVTFYLGIYVLSNLAAFGIVDIFARSTGSEQIADLASFSRRSFGVGIALLAVMLSLAGMPPFAGFVGKVFLFAAAVEAGWVWLAVVGVLNSILGVYYYLTVVKIAFLHRSEELEARPVKIQFSQGLAVALCVVAITVLGVVSAPAFDWALGVSISLF